MQHFYKNVPGWAAFVELYALMVRNAPMQARFVEVGSWAGRSAAFMGVEILNSGKQIKFDCIDPWYDGGVDLRDTEHRKLLGDVPLIEQFKRNVGPVLHLINPIQKLSVDAAKDFPDGSINYIMIDGDHTYEAVRDDIKAWMPKMRIGAIMSGDDYNWPGVRKAVDEAFGRKARIMTKAFNALDYKMGSAYWVVQL